MQDGLNQGMKLDGKERKGMVRIVHRCCKQWVGQILVLVAVAVAIADLWLMVFGLAAPALFPSPFSSPSSVFGLTFVLFCLSGSLSSTSTDCGPYWAFDNGKWQWFGMTRCLCGLLVFFSLSPFLRCGSFLFMVCVCSMS